MNFQRQGACSTGLCRLLTRANHCTNVFFVPGDTRKGIGGPGTGTLWILKNQFGRFWPVFAEASFFHEKGRHIRYVCIGGVINTLHLSSRDATRDVDPCLINTSLVEGLAAIIYLTGATAHLRSITAIAGTSTMWSCTVREMSPSPSFATDMAISVPSTSNTMQMGASGAMISTDIRTASSPSTTMDLGESIIWCCAARVDGRFLFLRITAGNSCRFTHEPTSTRAFVAMI